MKSKNIVARLASAMARVAASGCAMEGATVPRRAATFVDTVLRGIGQVMLQNNSLTGLLFLLGIFYNASVFGWAVLLGTATSTATAMLLGVERAQVRAGMFGFNGALVAIGLLYFLDPNLLTWTYVVLAAASTTVVMAALLRLLGTWNVPALTAPFVFTTLFFVMACARFGRLQTTGVLPTAGLPRAASTVEGIVTVSTVLEGLFNGIAQIFFQGNMVTGVIFALALLISSRIAGVAALLGSFTGIVVAWVMGAAEPAIRSGAFGFNSALTAIALVSVFFVLDVASAVYALLATVVTVVVFAAMSGALEPLGMPALTSPFVLVVWLFVLAGPLFPRLRRAAG